MPASFKDLRVWQEAMKFAVEVYRLTSAFPRHELYGLSQQLRRAAVSVPSNIAEGKGHRSSGRRTFRHEECFLNLSSNRCHRGVPTPNWPEY